MQCKPCTPETVAPDNATATVSPFLKRHPLLITFYLGCLAALGPLAIDMYLPAFPKIADSLHTDLGSIQRTLSAYFLGIALGQLVYGPVADRVGRKWPLYVGLAIFTLASVGCALAQDLTTLTVLRFLQALGGCAEIVVARAIVRDLFDDRQSARIFSQLMLVMGVAPIVAPIVGGYLAVHWGWHAIFWMLALASLALFLFTWFFFDESLPKHRRVRHSLSGVLGTYKGLLKDRLFMSYTAIVSLASTGLFAYVGGSSFIFQEIYHIPEQRFYLYFGPIAAGLISMSQVNGVLVYRYPLARILRWALLGSATAGVVLLASALTGIGGFWGIYLPLWCFMASLGLVFANATVLAMSAQGHIAGNASALIGSAQFALSAIGGIVVSVLESPASAYPALPMAATIALCAAVALAVSLTIRTPAPQGAQAAT